MALFGMTFVVQAVKVPTGSMQNTILIGDHLLVNKFIFAPGPIAPVPAAARDQRGDIIVFKYPGKFQGEERFRDNPKVDDTRPDNTPYKTNYVKRVIGLPGDGSRCATRRSSSTASRSPSTSSRPRTRRATSTRHPGERVRRSARRSQGNPEPAGEDSYNVYLDPEQHEGDTPPRRHV